MKPGDAKRAAMLVDALGDLGHVRKQLKRTKPRSGYERRGLEIATLDGNHNGDASGDGGIVIDVKTGKLLVRMIEPLIRAELKKMGVKL